MLQRFEIIYHLQPTPPPRKTRKTRILSNCAYYTRFSATRKDSKKTRSFWSSILRIYTYLQPPPTPTPSKNSKILRSSYKRNNKYIVATDKPMDIKIVSSPNELDLTVNDLLCRRGYSSRYY